MNATGNITAPPTPECVQRLGLGDFAYNLDNPGIYSGMYFVIVLLVFLMLIVDAERRIPWTQCKNVPDRFVFGTLVLLTLLGVAVVQAFSIPVAYYCTSVTTIQKGDFVAMWVCYGLITANLVLICIVAWCNLFINLWKGEKEKPHLNIFLLQVTMVVVAWIPVLYSFKGLVQIVKGAQYCCCATNRKGQGDTDVESGQRAGQATAGTANGENEAVRGEGESTHTETGSVPPPYTA